MRFSLLEKKEIVAEIVSKKVSITEASVKHHVARKTLYLWIKRKNSLANRYKTKTNSSLKHKVIVEITKNPSESLTDIAKNVKAGRHAVYNVLNSLKLTTDVSRHNFSKLYSYPRVLDKSIKTSAVRNVISNEKTITKIAKDLNVSRKTVYCWIKDYKENGNIKEGYVRGFDHPKSLGLGFDNLLLAEVIKNPSLSVHALAKSLNYSSHGVYNALKRHNLTYSASRILYANNHQSALVEPQTSSTWVEIKNKFADFVTPNLAPAPPPAFASIFKIFSLTLLLTFFISISLAYWISMLSSAPTVGASIGLTFASIALAAGSFFFIYSLKYYISLAIVLSYDNSKDELGNRNFMQWILGEKKKSQISSELGSVVGLKSNLDQIKLDDHPFVSVHVALYNEKNVIERLAKAVCSFDYENYEVILADDSTDESSDKIRAYQEKYLFKNEKLIVSKGEGWTLTSVEIRKGVYLRHLHRNTRSGFKGAALALALKLSDPRTKYVSIFDSDFVPYPDSLTSFLKYFQINDANGNCSRVAAVQGYQWHVLNKSENWITRGVRTEYSGSYVVERAGTEIYGGLKQISGSVYMIKKSALQEVGWGTSITEDFELTLKLYDAGYKVIYTPYIQAPAECVSTLRRMVRQRMRWAEGHSFNIKRMFVKLMTSSKLTFEEKVETVYLAPYYLQAAFFLVGTFSWLISETIFRVRLPFWTELWGWSLIITNVISLPLLNSVGLFLEESDEKDYSGIPSFVALSYIMVPFQAYAAIKGFIETEEGGWFRTPKSGRVTDVFTRSQFYRFIAGIIPTNNRAPALEEKYLAFTTANNLISNFNIKKHNVSRKIGKIALVFCLVTSLITANLFQMESNGKMNISYLDLINKQVFASAEFIKPKTLFDSNELPTFKFKIKNTKENSLFSSFGPKDAYAAASPSVTLLYKDQPVEGNPIDLSSTLDGNYEINIARLKFFKPGKYRLVVNYTQDDKEKSITQDFRWGVLAFNMERSEYSPNEDINFGFGVVDDAGRTICDANLQLIIIVPSEDNKKYVLSSANGGIKKSGKCSRTSVTNTPDYLAIFKAKNEEEEYGVELIADTYNGRREIADKIKITKNVPIVVTRSSYPTRIYPKAVYPVQIRIIPTQDFKGTITEILPPAFDAISISDQGEIGKGSLFDYETKRIITWAVDWKAGEEHVLSYTILFPMRSPEFYLIEPMLFLDGSNREIYKESRSWQVAADAIAVVQALSKSCGTVTSPATCDMAFASDNTAGNLIVTSIRLASTALTLNAPVDSQGNTYNLSAKDAQSNQTEAVYYAMNINAGANTVSWSTSGSILMQGGIVEYSGLATTNALDTGSVVHGIDTTSSTVHTTSAFSTANANEVVHVAWNPGNLNVNPWTAGDGYTIEGSNNITRFAQEDQTFSSTQTNITATITQNTSTAVGQYVVSGFIMAEVPENYSWHFYLTPLITIFIFLIAKKRRRI